MQSLAGQAEFAGKAGAKGSNFGLFPAEIGLLAVILAVLVVTILRDILLPGRVDWIAFAPPIAATLTLVGLGAFLRLRRPMPRMASFAVCFGIFSAFTAVVAIFVLQLFPFEHPTIDQKLIAVDAALGYDWAEFVTLLMAWPAFGYVLAWVYAAAIPQLVVVIAVLAAQEREQALHRFLWVGVVGMAITVGVWHVLPSVGPSPYHAIPAGAERIALIVDADYAALLMRYAAEGMPVIRPDLVIGVVAFPSFHMFMACMGLWYARGTAVFPAMVIISGLMIPATLGHGGHHLSDLIAAVLLFAVLAALAARFLPDRDARG
ncbi:phosphatase PAP2 family protein [Fuscovulum ytuae]|uniref:Phosphatase PAP2 family protein n=1 Tax=Fuscovulum ytuae TaxID=3042299 RepID=A0ABY8Q3V2_9RHOB|nr:phosphatase PAP2 family protein [Fuscovulum sp. YMD61]WGV14781.1 phosphatase PAP2 family protein [Fuscovulum sp. YMD61]